VTKTPKSRKHGKDWEKDLLKAFRNSNKRLFLLDYDGALASHNERGPGVLPEKNMRRCLEILAGDKRNTLVVISGSNRAAMASWFAELPLTLMAEHGAFCKRPGKTWEAWPVMVSETLMKDLRALIAKFSERFPGSWVEQKESGLVYHYRQCPPMSQLKARFMFKELLSEYTLSHGLKLVDGKGLVEIRPAALDKSTVYNYWMKNLNWDLLLAIGESDYEELFAALPEAAYAIKVGKDKSRAPLRLESQPLVQVLLENLCKQDDPFT